jgi:hypothetical protein
MKKKIDGEIGEKLNVFVFNFKNERRFFKMIVRKL